ncbi:hypothetical protein GCM10007103_00420 [Salinimicrobium marinum]|uniref:Uncharacterized protein n=1 Tax=Salinimicrobium marinum TaxID=680283 RepID=A0A918S6P9_9FLAO|nr:hypothetical protein [Salinimicrobium marinum]GHA23299.1 hypothetical protein GCM10007103_00420 [Salinimicrobium marinum]
MKKILLVFFFSFQLVQSQERVLEFNVNLNKNSEVFNVIDETTGNTALFTLKGRQLEAFLFDDSFNEIGTIEPEKIPNKFDNFSGYIIENKKFHLFLSNTKKDKFAKIFLDFSSGESSFNEISLDLKEEKFLESISHNDSYFIFTLPDGSEVIKVYRFTQANPPTITSVNFSSAYYLNDKNRPAKLNDLFIAYKGFSKVIEMGKMEMDQPNSIQQASKNVKTFVTGNKLIITLDENHYFTFLLEINLEDFQGTVERIEKPRLSEEINHTSSNSFVLDNHIYQIITTKDAIKFHVVDLENDKVINSHSVSRDEEIYFKNTPIIQEGGFYTSHREYDKTAKFIRKMKNLPVAITALEQDGKFQITMGSSLEKQATPMMGGFGMAGAMVSVAPGMAVGFNPMFFGYKTYSFSRTVEIKGLFDKEYNHLEGDINPHIFEKIKEVAERYEHISAETIFRKKDTIYWGYHDNYNNVYNIYRM